MSAVAVQLVRQAGLLLLDFDGPLTRLLPSPDNAEVARRALYEAHQYRVDFSAELETSTDHLAVLRATSRAGRPRALFAVERECTNAEIAAAHRSPLTVGARELLWCGPTGRGCRSWW